MKKTLNTIRSNLLSGFEEPYQQSNSLRTTTTVSIPVYVDCFVIDCIESPTMGCPKCSTRTEVVDVGFLELRKRSPQVTHLTGRLELNITLQRNETEAEAQTKPNSYKNRPRGTAPSKQPKHYRRNVTDHQLSNPLLITLKEPASYTF
jgi:hypothetical protein